MMEICNDNRFELIEKYKNELLENTNIADSKAEMDVIDSILFRFWQMDWLDKLEQFDRQKADIDELRKAKVVYATVDDSLGDLEEALKEIEALRKSHNELIVKNREQEEEIAHLKCLTIVGEVREIPIKCEKLACISWEHPLVEAVKSEAIKEFAERLKCTPFRGLIDGGIGFVIHKDIDNLVKEMTEEQK